MAIIDLRKLIDDASASWEAGLAIIVDRLMRAFVTETDKRNEDTSKLRTLKIQTVPLPDDNSLDVQFKRCRKAFKAIHSARPDILELFDRRSPGLWLVADNLRANRADELDRHLDYVRTYARDNFEWRRLVVEPLESDVSMRRKWFSELKTAIQVAGRPRLKNEARDKWLYEQRVRGVPYKTILASLNRKPKSWERLKNHQGVSAAVRRYAERHGKQLPPPGKRGRPRRRK